MNNVYLDVSKNNGTPKSSILIGFSIINHPFEGTPICGNIRIFITVFLGYLATPFHLTAFSVMFFFFLPPLGVPPCGGMCCFSQLGSWLGITGRCLLLVWFARRSGGDCLSCKHWMKLVIKYLSWMHLDVGRWIVFGWIFPEILDVSWCWFLVSVWFSYWFSAKNMVFCFHVWGSIR